MKGEDWKQTLTSLVFLLAFVALLMLAMSLWGCATGSAKPAAYEAELVLCNRQSETLAQSIECENKVREAYGRPLRDAGGDR